MSKFFDEMGYEEMHNDVWDVAPKSDKFSLIAKLDEEVEVKVKTPMGTTDKFKLNKVVLQGTVLAPIKSSIQLETFSSECWKSRKGTLLYKYKGCTLIPSLQMIDDILIVSKCGVQALELNAALNAFIEGKKLRMSQEKSHNLHVSKVRKRCDLKLKVHEDEMERTDSFIYLGDKVTENGSVEETIKLRKVKSIGIRSQICSILKNVTLGAFYIKTALILRESMFVNGIITNSESWNFISLKQMKSLEDEDSRLWSSIFASPKCTNRVIYYLETATLPLRYILSKRLFLYFWHILSRPDHELISRVYKAQQLRPVRHDHCLRIKEEKERYGITLSDQEIQNMSKNKFKRYISDKIEKYAFTQLILSAKNQSKCQFILKNIDIADIKIQQYLICEDLMKEEQILLFSLRSQTFPVKSNYKYLHKDNMICRACHLPETVENEIHFSETCPVFSDERGSEKLYYNDVFGTLDVQIRFVKLFKIIARKWNLILEVENQPSRWTLPAP